MELTEQKKRQYAEILQTVEKAILDGSLNSLLLSANLGKNSHNMILGKTVDISVSFTHLLRQHEKSIKFIYATANTLNELLKDETI